MDVLRRTAGDAARVAAVRDPTLPPHFVGLVNAVVDVGFTIERIAEPHADEEMARRVPHIADTRIVAYYLHVRCRKATPPVP